jgi:hypothetical protein
MEELTSEHLAQFSRPLAYFAGTRSCKLQSPIFGNNSAKRINVAVGELLAERMEVIPRIPLRADQFPSNAVTHLGREIDAQTRGFLERHTAGFAAAPRQID